MSSEPATSSQPVFQALIAPHRSLSARGRAAVVGIILVFSLVIAARFFVLGAWPVVLFSLLEAPMIVVLLWINVRRARAHELIMLDAEAITVVRTDQHGRRQSFSLPAAWLQIDLLEDSGVPRIIISSHGRRREVGSFLHEPAKKSLFEGLRRAIHDVRNPSFDNPQLRE
jgi:uncharacterized membrane protein